MLATAFFLLIERVFFAAAMHKVLDGGWFPLALGAIVFFVMMTWRRGRESCSSGCVARRRRWKGS